MRFWGKSTFAQARIGPLHRPEPGSSSTATRQRDVPAPGLHAHAHLSTKSGGRTTGSMHTRSLCILNQRRSDARAIRPTTAFQFKSTLYLPSRDRENARAPEITDGESQPRIINLPRENRQPLEPTIKINQTLARTSPAPRTKSNLNPFHSRLPQQLPPPYRFEARKTMSRHTPHARTHHQEIPRLVCSAIIQ